MKICECGKCGLATKPGKRFIWGHNQRGRKNSAVSISLSGVSRPEKTKLKISLAKKGKKFTEQHKKNLSDFSLGKNKGHPYYGGGRKKIRISITCDFCGIEILRPPSLIGELNFCSRDCFYKYRSKKMKEFWANPKNAEKRFKEQMRHPNNSELRTDFLIQKTRPTDFHYSGNGIIWIGGKCPDWFNINGKKQVIELFGDYFHSEQVTGRTKEQEESQRVEHFNKYGYNCLIIWESELKNQEQIIEKIKKFKE